MHNCRSTSLKQGSTGTNIDGNRTSVRLERSPIQSSLRFSEVTTDPDRTLSFQKAYRVGDAKLRWNAQKQVNMIRHGFAFHQFNFALPTQLPKNLPNLRPKTSEKLSSPIFWYNHNMIFTVPLHVGLTTPVFHFRSSCTPRGLPTGGSFLCSGNGEA